MNKLNKKLLVTATLAATLVSTGAFADASHEFDAFDAFRRSPVRTKHSENVFNSIELDYDGNSGDGSSPRRATSSTRDHFSGAAAASAQPKPTTVWTKLYGVVSSFVKLIFG